MKKIKMNPKLVAALKEQDRAFVSAFGRDPGPHDPIFFDPASDTPQMYSEVGQREITELMCAAMSKAGIDPSFIYAFRKTGRILTEENITLLEPSELDEWNDAIDEYRIKQIRQ